MFFFNLMFETVNLDSCFTNHIFIQIFHICVWYFFNIFIDIHSKTLTFNPNYRSVYLMILHYFHT